MRWCRHDIPSWQVTHHGIRLKRHTHLRGSFRQLGHSVFNDGHIDPVDLNRLGLLHDPFGLRDVIEQGIQWYALVSGSLTGSPVGQVIRINSWTQSPVRCRQTMIGRRCHLVLGQPITESFIRIHAKGMHQIMNGLPNRGRQPEIIGCLTVSRIAHTMMIDHVNRRETTNFTFDEHGITQKVTLVAVGHVRTMRFNR